MTDYYPPPGELAPGVSVWAYLRDSGGPNQEKSIQQQQAEVMAYCSRYGLYLARLFADEAKSGSSTKGREAFLEMVDLADAEPPAGLLIWNHARFARDMDTADYYKGKLRRRGVIIHSMTDNIPDGPYGRVIENLVDFANEENNRQNRRYVKRALDSLFQQGYSFGIPPRGYMAIPEVTGTRRDGKARTGQRFIPNPESAPLVEQAFKLRAQGKTYGDILKAIPGIFKSISCFRTCFTNPAYIGVGVWKDLRIPNHHPALIDWDTWEAVQKIQTASKHKSTGGRGASLLRPNLLSGLAFCAECGSAMVKTKSNHWPCYLCNQKRVKQNAKVCPSRHVNAVRAEKAVLEAVTGRILTPEFIGGLLTDIQSKYNNGPELEAQQAQLEKQLEACKGKINHLLDLAERLGAGDVLARLQEREAEKKQIILDLADLEARRKKAQTIITPEALALALEALRADVDTAIKAEDVTALKQILARFITKVELGYKIIRIWYQFPFEALYNTESIPLSGGTQIKP